MTRIQKIILIVLAVVDLVVIGVMAVLVFTSMQALPNVTPLPLPTTEIAAATREVIPTWTPTATSTPAGTPLPLPTRTPRPTRTPFPTASPSPTATPAPVELENPEFDMLMTNRIPGWQWDAFINYRPGETYDPHNSYAEPMFMAADDPLRRISGSTLKIETIRWLKFRAWVYQPITVTPGSTVYFRVKANAFSSIDTLVLRAGVNPYGEGCNRARWGEVDINQDDGIVTITSPRVVVPEPGRITVCLFAEPNYPDVSNAAFFDQAELIVAPPP